MQECREIENKSMNIEVQEPRAIASAVSIPFAGRKISTLSTLQGWIPWSMISGKNERIYRNLESQTKAMEEISSNNEYHFIKNLTPRLFALDPSYKRKLN